MLRLFSWIQKPSRWFNRIQIFILQQNYQEKFDEKLRERFFKTYKVSHHDNKKLILLLQNG